MVPSGLNAQRLIAVSARPRWHIAGVAVRQSAFARAGGPCRHALPRQGQAGWRSERYFAPGSKNVGFGPCCGGPNTRQLIPFHDPPMSLSMSFRDKAIRSQIRSSACPQPDRHSASSIPNTSRAFTIFAESDVAALCASTVRRALRANNGPRSATIRVVSQVAETWLQSVTKSKPPLVAIVAN